MQPMSTHNLTQAKTQDITQDQSNYEYYLLANAIKACVVHLHGLQSLVRYTWLYFVLFEIYFFSRINESRLLCKNCVQMRSFTLLLNASLHWPQFRHLSFIQMIHIHDILTPQKIALSPITSNI